LTNGRNCHILREKEACSEEGKIPFLNPANQIPGEPVVKKAMKNGPFSVQEGVKYD